MIALNLLIMEKKSDNLPIRALAKDREKNKEEKTQNGYTSLFRLVKERNASWA